MPAARSSKSPPKDPNREPQADSAKTLHLPRKQAKRLFLGKLAAGLLLFVALVFPARALNFVVTKTADTNDGACDADCSLREAVIAANASAGADSITLPAGTYTFTITGTGEDAAATGDLDVTENLTINGAGSATTIVDANLLDRVFQVLGAVSLTLNDLTVTNGQATTFENGGGVWAENPGGTVILNNVVVTLNSASGTLGGGVDAANATITNSVISENQATVGGGIYLTGGVSTITTTTIFNNSAQFVGAGIIVDDQNPLVITDSTIRGNTLSGAGASGGGVSIFGNPSTVTITGSTIDGNRLLADGFGGGIENDYTLTMTNCTVSGNSIASGSTFGGGGIFNQGTLILIDSTIASNSAPTSGGNLQNLAGTTTLTNTIVANAPSGGNCSGTITDGGTNLQFPGTTCGAGIPSADPVLGPLANNGGPTQTHALLAGSAAIDTGTTGCPPNPATDQRGVSRPQGPACDIGAFEVQGAVTPTPTPTGSATPTPTVTGVPPTPTVTPTPLPGPAAAVPTLSWPMLALFALALAAAAVFFLKRS